MDIGSVDWILPKTFYDFRDHSFIVLRRKGISKRRIQVEQL